MAPAFPLLDLPTDLLFNVLSRVQWSARRVSRTFNAAICAGRGSLLIPGGNSNDGDRLRAVLSRLPQLTDLQTLSEDFTDVTIFAACTAVRRMLLSTSAMHLANLDALAPLTRLENLTLTQLSQLTGVQLPTACSQHLTSLTLYGCFILTEIGPLACCTALQHLKLFMCEHVSNIGALAACTRLVQLSLDCCYNIRDISPLSACTLLEGLSLGGCGMSRISPLAACCRLQQLHLSSCPENIDLSVLASLSALQSLELCGTGILNFHPLAGCKHLTHLDISECVDEAGGFRCITACQQLASVVWQNDSVNFNFLSRLGQLTRVVMRGSDTWNLGGITRLTALIALDVGSCTGWARGVSLLGSLVLLEELDLTFCHVTDVCSLASCRRLKHLNLSENAALADVRPLAQCCALRVLHLSGCRAVSDVSSLAACTRLGALHLERGCGAAVNLPALLALQGLTFLSVSRGIDVSCLGGTFLEHAVVPL